MLDTRARGFVQPIIEKAARFFIRKGFSANGVTILAFAIGLIPAVLYIIGVNPIISVSILWMSGFLDAVDGTVARITKSSSSIGTLMDITFDRLVEISLIIAIMVITPEVSWLLALLSSSIVLSMTIFLTVGSISDKQTEKSFYYQPGLAERTEGFIFFSLMLIFPKYLIVIISAFIVAIIYTAVQRFVEAVKMFD